MIIKKKDQINIDIFKEQQTTLHNVLVSLLY